MAVSTLYVISDAQWIPDGQTVRAPLPAHTCQLSFQKLAECIQALEKVSKFPKGKNEAHNVLEHKGLKNPAGCEIRPLILPIHFQ